MAQIKIVQTNKEDGTETVLSLEEAVKKLSGWYSDVDWVEQDLLNGVLFQTPFSYFKILEDKNANNHN